MKPRPSLARPHTSQQALAGFTLLESVVALLLVAIVAAYAVPRAFNASAMTLDAQARTLASHVQRAQLLATTSGVPVHVCTLGNTYLIQVGSTLSGQPCPLTAPSQTSPTQPVVVTLSQQATLTAMPNPLSFDTRGQPGSAGTFQLHAAQAESSITVSYTAVTGLIALSTP